MSKDFVLRDRFSGMMAFMAVAREKSFTQAGVQLGLTQSAVSHAVGDLEKALGVRLFSRNTRMVTLSEAGAHLLRTVAPQFEKIDGAVSALHARRDMPTGNIRLTAPDHAIRTLIAPALKTFLPKYPGIQIEVMSENEFVDIAASRCDAGVRMGDQLQQDMIAVRIGPDIRFVVVATQAYFLHRALPKTPQDLSLHNCINLRFQSSGGIWAWEFEKDGVTCETRVNGQLVFNNLFEAFDATVAGLGLGYVPQELAEPFIRSGHFVQCLKDWSPAWPGFHLYYPSRRQPSGAMALFIDALRYEPSAS